MPEGPIVCDAGPLIALSLVGHLGILEKLYHRVLVPNAVVEEVVGAGLGRIGAAELEAASWIERERRRLSDEPEVATQPGR